MAKYSAKGCKIKYGSSATPTDELANVDTVGIDLGALGTIEVTTHDSTSKEYVDEGVRDTPEITFTLIYDPANTGHEAIRAAFAARTMYYLTVVLPDSGAAQWACSGKFTSFRIPPRGPKDPLTAEVSFKAFSAETFTQ